MCVLAVGMAEVSTCEITVYEGQRVIKGEQLGMFHYGGSTHCLIFRPEVQLEFDLHGQKPGPALEEHSDQFEDCNRDKKMMPYTLGCRSSLAAQRAESPTLRSMRRDVETELRFVTCDTARRKGRPQLR